MIQISVNSEIHQISEDTTIEILLKHLEIAKEGTAVAVNEKVVPRSNHGSYRLSGGDKLEIIRAVGGG